ncbi:hypothetical protein LCGC14_1294860 [marine sediment metagenome]|uniref:Lipoprotein n=1 Tax=marine sediment metagenome TaxID=412755 RepID=A0A0F9LC87_9ZZZZ
MRSALSVVMLLFVMGCSTVQPIPEIPLDILIARAETRAAVKNLPIYCPNCRELLYYYQKDEIVIGDEILTKDFLPVGDIPSPDQDDPMICFYCEAYFEGYDYSCWKNDLGIPVKYAWAYTFLTKVDGEWVWTPYELDILE